MSRILAALAVVVFVSTGSADDKKLDSAKLVGKWELTKSTDENAPKGAIIDFTKDNKVNVMLTADGQKFELSGTYKLEGDKLSVKLKLPNGTEQEETDTIKNLTDDKLVLIDKDKKETEFTKKK